MKLRNTKDFTKGNLSPYLVSLAVPLMVGNILQEFYNTIDAFVVGRFAGKEEFAAIGIAGTAMNLFLFALVGCCNGFSILFAQAYGKKYGGTQKTSFQCSDCGIGVCAISYVYRTYLYESIINIVTNSNQFTWLCIFLSFLDIFNEIKQEIPHF